MNNFDDLFEQQPQAETASQKQESQKERPKRQLVAGKRGKAAKRSLCHLG